MINNTCVMCTVAWQRQRLPRYSSPCLCVMTAPPDKTQFHNSWFKVQLHLLFKQSSFWNICLCVHCAMHIAVHICFSFKQTGTKVRIVAFLSDRGIFLLNGIGFAKERLLCCSPADAWECKSQLALGFHSRFSISLLPLFNCLLLTFPSNIATSSQLMLLIVQITTCTNTWLFSSEAFFNCVACCPFQLPDASRFPLLEFKCKSQLDSFMCLSIMYVWFLPLRSLNL